MNSNSMRPHSKSGASSTVVIAVGRRDHDEVYLQATQRLST